MHFSWGLWTYPCFNLALLRSLFSAGLHLWLNRHLLYDYKFDTSCVFPWNTMLSSPRVPACPTKVRPCLESLLLPKWDQTHDIVQRAFFFLLVCHTHFVCACRLRSLSFRYSLVFFWRAHNPSRARWPWSSLTWNLHGSDSALWESGCDGSHGQFEISRLKSVTSAEVQWIRFGTPGLFTMSDSHYCGSDPESKVAVKVPVGRGS